jgi:hypothetical protein
MKLDVEYLIGRRFRFAGIVAPDVTFVSADVKRGTVRAHAEDGGRLAMPVSDVLSGIRAGALVESETGVPFVLNRDGSTDEPLRTGLKTGIAGTGKRLLVWTANGWIGV